MPRDSSLIIRSKIRFLTDNSQRLFFIRCKTTGFCKACQHAFRLCKLLLWKINVNKCCLFSSVGACVFHLDFHCDFRFGCLCKCCIHLKCSIGQTKTKWIHHAVSSLFERLEITITNVDIFRVIVLLQTSEILCTWIIFNGRSNGGCKLSRWCHPSH